MELSSRSLQHSSVESRSDEEPDAFSQESVGTGSSSRQEATGGFSSAQSTPTRVAALQSDRFDYAFRACMLGDAQSGKRALAHSLVYGKYSKQAALQDSVLNQMCGYVGIFFHFGLADRAAQHQLDGHDHVGRQRYHQNPVV